MATVQSKLRYRCPECDHVFRLRDTPSRGKKIRCDDCGH
ncbi:MAG: hypothetical protein HY289_11235, partial [Planctomycetes bacterium]|nr:hypothetical protein [Planctomycetota bacterium]